MNEHQRCIELAAASIDFPLSPREQQALRTHLTLCDSCSVTVRGFRDDAARLAALPQPAAPVSVRDAVLDAATRRQRHGSGMRWALVATMLAAVLVTGSFVAGAVVDRSQQPQVPGPTDGLAPRPTATPRSVAGWSDLGDISDAFGGRTVLSVMTAPDGGLVAFGRERTSATPVVWVSDDGTRWTEVDQRAADVFGGDVPHSGGLTGAGMLVLGREISTETGPQRAIWSSPDGRVWSRQTDASALLGTDQDDLTLVTGPAGAIVWAPSGKVWVTTDGSTWKSGSIGHTGVTDVSVNADGFVAVGRSASDAFLSTSANGRTWGTPQLTRAASGTQVGIERSMDGTEAIWVGTQRWQRSGSTWRSRSGESVPKVPDPASIVGGRTDLLAVGSPSSAGTYRAWTWDGTGAWAAENAGAESGNADPTVVAVAGYDSGWFVLTRRGNALHAWSVEP